MEHNGPNKSSKFLNNIRPRRHKQTFNGMSVCPWTHTRSTVAAAWCLPQRHSTQSFKNAFSWKIKERINRGKEHDADNWIWYTVWFLYMKKQTHWSLVMGRSHWCWVRAFSHRSSSHKSEGPVFKSICHHTSCLFLPEGGTRFWSQHIRKELCDKTPLNGGIFQRLH